MIQWNKTTLNSINWTFTLNYGTLMFFPYEKETMEKKMLGANYSNINSKNENTKFTLHIRFAWPRIFYKMEQYLLGHIIFRSVPFLNLELFWLSVDKRIELIWRGRGTVWGYELIVVRQQVCEQCMTFYVW